MKKTIFGITFALASLVGFTAAAQNTTQETGKAATEQVGKQCKEKGCKGKKDDKKRGDKKDLKNKKRNPMDRFEGLNLTDNQTKQLKALHEARAEKKAAAKKEKEQQRSMAKAEKEKNRQAYLASVKEILTPEQYTKFMEKESMKKAGKSKKHNFASKGKDCKRKCGKNKSKQNKG